jgi:hypothetical protein
MHPIAVGTYVTHVADNKRGKVVDWTQNVVYGAATTWEYVIDMDQDDGGGRWNAVSSSFDNGDWVLGTLV